MNDYSKYIHKSRYARWDDKKKRRETWEETVDRYINFWVDRHPEHTAILTSSVRTHILNMEVMPSMRALIDRWKGS